MTFTEWFIFFLIIQVVHFLGTWKLYQRAGRKAWEAAIPVYNAIVLNADHQPAKMVGDLNVHSYCKSYHYSGDLGGNHQKFWSKFNCRNLCGNTYLRPLYLLRKLRDKRCLHRRS